MGVFLFKGNSGQCSTLAQGLDTEYPVSSSNVLRWSQFAYLASASLSYQVNDRYDNPNNYDHLAQHNWFDSTGQLATQDAA